MFAWFQLYYTPDQLDLCVDVSYDDVVSTDTHGVKPDNIFSALDEWLPKGQITETCRRVMYTAPSEMACYPSRLLH